MMKVIKRGVFIDSIFYCSIALLGYFSTYDYTTDYAVIRSLPDNKYDYTVLVSCIAVIVVVLLSGPANYYAFKNTLYFMITGRKNVSTFL